MNRFIKIISAFVLVFSVTFAYAGEKEKKVYVFGVSASFTDSIVYFTGIQELDSVKLKKDFLPFWDQYSYQLKHYVEQTIGLPNRTNMVYYSDSQKKLLKRLSKLRSKYQKNKSVVLKNIEPTEFVFRRIDD